MNAKHYEVCITNRLCGVLDACGNLRPQYRYRRHHRSRASAERYAEALSRRISAAHGVAIYEVGA